MTISQLLTFIRKHGNRCYQVPTSGKICAEVIVSENGQSHGEWEEIEPALKDVRNWLGY